MCKGVTNSPSWRTDDWSPSARPRSFWEKPVQRGFNLHGWSACIWRKPARMTVVHRSGWGGALRRIRWIAALTLGEGLRLRLGHLVATIAGLLLLASRW